jgi:pimeloyl-ACP methyl ester carboxylesterase
MEIVLVHGLSGSSRWWQPLLPSLAEHDVTLLDVPRHWPLDWLAERLAGRRRPVLVGHSLGALLAARAAPRAELGGLVLVCPAGLPLGRGAAGFGGPLVSALRLAGPRFLATILPDALRAGPLSLATGARLALTTDVRDELRAVDVPTLVVFGERDALVPPALAPQWRDALPAARVTVLDACGHVPMVERPLALAAELLAFVEEVERETRERLR